MRLKLFYQLDTNLSSGNREPRLKNWLYQIVLWASLWDIFLFNDQRAKAQPTVGYATPGELGTLGCRRKHVECDGLNENGPPKAHIFECLVPS